MVDSIYGKYATSGKLGPDGNDDYDLNLILSV